MEGLFQLLIEVLLQLILEVLVNGVVHTTSSKRKEINPALVGAGYIAVGVMFGLISLALLPQPMFSTSIMKWLALVAGILATGALASVFGAWRRRRGRMVLRIDRFAYGALLGFGFGIVRLLSP